MDSDSLITLVLFIAFFVLPSVFKQIKKRKMKNSPQKPAKISFFSKIGDQIRRYLAELEKQSQRQKNAVSQEKESFWDTLDEEREEETWADETSVYESPQTATEPFSEPLKPKTQKIKRPPIQMPDMDMVQGPSMSLKFRKNPLQNAVVFSEILSKPVALRGWDK